MKHFLLAGIMIAALTACTTRELPIPKRSEMTSQLYMGADYSDQIFYSLAEGKEVSRNLKTDWDISFESGAEGFHVLLNGSKLMYAYNTGTNDFNAVTDTAGFASGKKMDAASGDLDATAIGDWRTDHPVYIIDRGITVQGAIGLVKFQVTNVTASGYSIICQDMATEKKFTLDIQKDNAYNNIFLSLNDGGKVVTIEPPKDKWDLCFTQYSVEIPIPYMVTGVLTNRYQTETAMDSLTAFAAIDLAFAQQMEFSKSLDVIGYEWKSYDLEAGIYQVDLSKNYIVKTSEDFFYKLRFVDFYNEQGEKGYPKWTVQRL